MLSFKCRFFIQFIVYGQCFSGQHKVLNSTFPECCWTCSKCSGTSVSRDINMITCTQCPTGFTSNVNNTECIAIIDVYMKWDDPIQWIILVWVILNLSLATTTFIVLAKFRDTPVMMSSNKGLMFLLLLSIVSFNVITIIRTGRPTNLKCQLKPIFIGFCISLNVGKLLALYCIVLY